MKKSPKRRALTAPRPTTSRPSSSARPFVALALATAQLCATRGWAAPPAAATASPPAGEIELALPFEGIWGVLQGFDSGDTHTGYAAFALDFVPPQKMVSLARVKRPRLSDFACFGRPVLAPADGTVVRVANRFPDLPPYSKGRRARGSGNFVIIQHAPRIFTELVHLQARSVRVAVGDTVRRGQELARCGNSGSATTPHLHLGLLSSIDPITTARIKLAHYQWLAPDRRWLPGDGEPRQGQFIRPDPALQSSGR